MIKYSSLALACWISTATENLYVNAFTPLSLQHSHAEQSLSIAQRPFVTPNSSHRSPSPLFNSFLGMEDDDDDEEEEEEEEFVGSLSSESASPFGLKLDPWDPNPTIKPRPSRYFKNEKAEAQEDDSELEQNLSSEEREENLSVMRQLRKTDLPDLRRRKDHAGWVEANNDLKRRIAKDPWFRVNERLRDAMQLGKPDQEVEYLKELAEKMGGPPPGLEMSRDYAVHTEIYDIGLSPARAASMMEREIRQERAARGRALMAERQQNLDAQQQQFEDDLRNPGLRADKEAKERRERTMRRLFSEIEEDNKKKRERAKEILGKVPETPESRTKAMEKALKEARDELKKMRREAIGGSAETTEQDETTREQAAKLEKMAGSDDKKKEVVTEGGRPRLPGDTDVTQGELTVPIESGSTCRSGPLEVKVTSSYNSEQSDPPMRKHCFQYTIQITNHGSETLQLLGRRFEIQTVGASLKDIVQGEGVTGRTPVLKPGEVFEYTSTAPLSVRPIGTTIIAARMQGEYRYVFLKDGQETATEEQIEKGGDETAELGIFHFVFPEDQRVKPFRSTDEDEDDDEEEEEEEELKAKSSSASTSDSSSSSTSGSSTSSSPATTPASTLPGDDDMKTGDLSIALNDSSEEVTDDVRVAVTTSYRPERSDEAMEKHCFAYNIRITNESKQAIQLVSRRFEIQTIGSVQKDVVQGPGVTGRQPILQAGESFEYTSTAPLSVKPLLGKTPVVARMQGEYNFVQLADDGTTPISSTPLQAKLGRFHFILPALT